MEVEIRELKECDKTDVLDLIATDHLRPEGILEKDTRYWGAFIGDKLVGAIGCEYENQCGLLRSAIVDRQYRKMGIAERLTQELLQQAKEANIKDIYLFSTGAGGYWTRLGFKQVPLAEVVDKLANTPQVKLFERLGWLPTEIAFKFWLADS
jgi:N-acetylglutamate synthase-like GNAT family acetyltransferase